MSQEFRKIIKEQLIPQISFKTTFSNCVLKALTLRQWKQCENGQWNLQWCEKERINDVFAGGISGTQKVNHFRLYTQLCRKDMLMKNVKNQKRILANEKQLVEEEWNFLPATYFLPSQYVMFVKEFNKSGGGLWILKPTGRSQGSGIFLVDKISQVAPYRNKSIANTENQTAVAEGIPSNQLKSQGNKKNQTEKQKTKTKISHPKHNRSQVDSDSSETNSLQQKENVHEEEQTNQNQTFVIQRYIHNPLLFGRKKFDLRIYVLCTDYQKLTVWLYRDGFARFTHEPYDSSNIGNLGSHLTNVKIQKDCENYDAVRGGKWLLNQFKLYLFTVYSRQKVDECFCNIKDIILRSLMAVKIKILPSKSSFELYGYDFMLDEELKPWLIEVNGGPSMSANTDIDCKLKCGLVDDVLTVLDLEGFRRGNEMTVGGFDLIMKEDRKVREPENSEFQSTLGSKNQRIKVIRKIARQFLFRKEESSKYATNPKQPTEKVKKQKPKEKLLPSFYYERRRHLPDDLSIHDLKNKLRALQANQLMSARDDFMPLRKQEPC